MELEDVITIRTPEGVELKLALAGLGSRFIAGTADLIIQLVSIVILAVVTGALGGANGFLAAIFFIGLFAITLLYPIFFEVLARGRTPGKRWTHLRVVRADGSPVDLPASAIRNLMRLLDGPPLFYLPTLIGIATSACNQRPGDIAAGTLVIRESPRAPPREGGRTEAAPLAVGAAWDVSAITIEELAVVRRFLERRESLDRRAREPRPARARASTGARASLDRRAREQLALRLSGGLRPKVAGVPAGLGAEAFLEELAKVKASRR